MLKLFTLYTFKMIFGGLENELSNYSKMVYISCLINHFEELELSEKNAHSFRIWKFEMEFDKSIKGFIELEKAGIVSIEPDHVVFHNTWGQHIDRSALSNPFKEAPYNSVARFKKEILESETTRDYVLMKYKIQSDIYPTLVNKFVDQQVALNKTYSDLHEVTKHFYYWVGKNKNNTDGRGKSTTILGM